MFKNFRVEVEQGINHCLIMRDTHSSDLTSLTKNALSFLEQQTSDKNQKHTLVVSDIVGDELVVDMFYVNLIKAAHSQQIDRMITIGTALKRFASQFSVPTVCFETCEEFLNSDLIKAFHDEVILLKIAPQFQPERVLNHLQKLAHDTVLEINFDAMFHNVAYFKSKIPAQTKMMAMVKASAYGSGSIEVAQALQHLGLDYMAVAFTNEGVDLREAGIKTPIMVLDPMQPALHHLISHHLEPEIASFEMLEMMLKEARRHDVTHYPIHIKFDTGMHRAGFEHEDMPQLVDKLLHQDALKVVSAFSHLAAADEEGESMRHFTLQQIALFDQLCSELKDGLGHTFMTHILNTAGIECYHDYPHDMVRLGIGLWGVNCRNEDKLRSVFSWRTKIMQVKSVKAGETVGYGRKGQVKHAMEVALLPIGYADGIDRRLGNGHGYFFYKGQKVYTIGNICMDLLMIDVTGLQAKVGEEIIIFDDYQNIGGMAQLLGTIPYEVLTSISPRVRRVYYRD